MVIFDGSPSQPDDLPSVVFTALGAASVCWENPGGGSGIFDSTRAAAIGEEVLAWIRAHYACIDTHLRLEEKR